jgi:multidrug efflux pump subunit AcrB
MFSIASRARPYFGAVVLTAALLTVGGIYSAVHMPSSVYPEVTFPRITVVARVAGLAVPNMDVQVTQPLEQAVSTVIGVAQVRSKTIRGASELSIDFNPGTDMRRAEELTWNRISAIRSQLPQDVDLTVEQMTPSVFPIISVVLTGGESRARLRDYAYYELAPLIKNLHDVLYANVAGGDLREIEVLPRMTDLFAAGLSAADLADQIGKAHRLQPVGRVEARPYGWQFILNAQTEKARELEDLVIATKNGQVLRLRDLADVRILQQDRALSIGFAGQDAVVITIFRRLGGDTVAISGELRALLKKIARKPADEELQARGIYDLPGNVRATVGYDQATFVQNSVLNVRDAILVGGAFSILILLAFLRSWRATLISALAIPVTLAITLLFLHWSGETLNLMSLGGLAVAIGLIIDDTVVVIENIARHLAKGREAANGPSVRDPVDAASGEITGAVIGSTLTTVLVFVPLAFITGVYGQFFASLSWSLAIAVLVSMVISLTLVPVFAAKFLAGRPMPGPGPIYRFLVHIYELMLTFVLRFPRTVLVVAVLSIGIGVVLFTGIPAFHVDFSNGFQPLVLNEQEKGKPPPAPYFKGLQTGLMPTMDEGAFVLDYWAPAGTPLETTEKLARQIEHLLSENPDIDAYVRRTGAELGLFATQTFRGDIQVVLRPAEQDPYNLLFKPVRPEFSKVEDELKEKGKEIARQKHGAKFTEDQMWEEGKKYIRDKYRRRTVIEIMAEIEDEIKEHFSEHQLKVELMQIMQDELSDMSGASRPIEIKLFGPSYTTLRELAHEIGEMLEEKGKGRGIHEVEDNVRAGNPDLMVNVKSVPAVRWRLSSQEIERQLKAIYLGQVATQVRESAARITDVRVRYSDRERFGTGRFDMDLLRDQWILLPEGLVPVPGATRAMQVRDLADVKAIRTPDEQWRENQQPAIFVTAQLKESEAGLGSVIADIRGWMAELEADGKLPSGYRWELGGHFIRQQEAFRSLLVVMIVAIVLVYIMLAFQFKSALLPLVIFLTQPLSLVSGLFALWLTQTPLNVSSYMGAILLIGLDMKNGILLVEYIQQLRRQGMELKAALIDAGRTRFRPILMTSLAAILGLFPLALGIGPGAQMQRPLAIMVIGGLTANMLFTRLVIPVGYLVVERWTAKSAV